MKLAQLVLSFAMALACSSHAAAPEAFVKAKDPVSIPKDASQAPLRLNHFNHLYADIEIDGKAMGVVHIYAEYPAYTYAIEPNEGFTCVDDVSRGLVMLVREWLKNPNPELLRKIRRLTEFVLHQQNENGYFNNFIWGDLSTNTSYKTSVAELNWWSLRALWSLEEAFPVLSFDPSLAARMQAATGRLVANLERDLRQVPRRTTVVSGLTLPTWLPAGSGADQAAEAINALLLNERRTGDPQLPVLIEKLADGMLLMQMGDADTYPYGMFLSWGNTWHAWGNGQAYALLQAGERLGRKDYIASALREVDNFYPYLLRHGFAETIEIRAEGAGFVEVGRRPYPQIAYGLRPMVFAAEKAFSLTRDPKYHVLARELGGWLQGRNEAHAPMLDPHTGLTFDGIVGPAQINKNSGAESTIEGLLIQQALRDGIQ
jgi:hypothetical protein